MPHCAKINETPSRPEFTVEGGEGDPRRGGNRDGIGYRSLGIPLTPVRGRSKHDLTGGTK